MHREIRNKGTRPAGALNYNLRVFALILLTAQISRAGVIVNDKLIAGPPENVETKDPQLAKDSLGNIYCAWSNKLNNTYWDEVHFQRFDIYGDRNSGHVEYGGDTESDQGNPPPRIAMSPDGRVVIAWNELYIPDGVIVEDRGYVQILDSVLMPISQPIRYENHAGWYAGLVINGLGIGPDSANGFHVVYDWGGKDVVQRFSWDGAWLGDTIQLLYPYNDDGLSPGPCWSGTEIYTCGAIGEPRMVLLDNGVWAFAWWGPAFKGTDIETSYPMYRLFDEEMVPLDTMRIVSCDGYPCTVSDSLIGWGAHPYISAMANSYFVVTYQQNLNWPYSSLPYSRVYRGDGSAVTESFNAADAYPNALYFHAKPVGADDGTFVVLWPDYRYGGYGLNLFAQRFDTLGNPIGVNHQINDINGSLGSNELLFDGIVVDSLLIIVWVDVRDYPPYEGLLYWQTMTLSSVGKVTPGDVDINDSINSTDIIRLVNYTFKGGQPPEPQAPAGDVNGDCSVTSADIIYLVNYVFKAGSEPVNAGCLTGPL